MAVAFVLDVAEELVPLTSEMVLLLLVMLDRELIVALATEKAVMFVVTVALTVSVVDSLRKTEAVNTS